MYSWLDTHFISYIDFFNSENIKNLIIFILSNIKINLSQKEL